MPMALRYAADVTRRYAAMLLMLPLTLTAHDTAICHASAPLRAFRHMLLMPLPLPC